MDIVHDNAGLRQSYLPNQITREQAGRFILSKQGLLGKYRFAGKDGAYQYIRQAGIKRLARFNNCSY